MMSDPGSFIINTSRQSLHRGKRIDEVPERYLNWCLIDGVNCIPPDMLEAIEKFTGRVARRNTEGLTKMQRKKRNYREKNDAARLAKQPLPYPSKKKKPETWQNFGTKTFDCSHLFSGTRADLGKPVVASTAKRAGLVGGNPPESASGGDVPAQGTLEQWGWFEGTVAAGSVVDADKSSAQTAGEGGQMLP